MRPSDSDLSVALRRLSPGDRALLELSLVRDVPDAEIATLLSLPPDEVTHRRERLLERLGARGGTGAPNTDEDVRAALSHPERSGRARAATIGLLLLPGALTAYLGFNAGGFFPDGTAAATVIVCVALVLRVTLADRPVEGLGRLGVLVAGLLVTFAAWILLSGSWSHASARALVEFDRALLYALTFALFATLPRSTRNLRVMLRGFAGAAVVICLVGLASRLLPDLVPSAPNVSNERLAYPVTYWNALGMLAALGLLACFHLSADNSEPRAGRILAAAAVPGLAVTLFFTFSRGAIAVLLVALVVYAVLARPRGLPSALIAIVPPSVVSLVIAYGADMLATKNPTAPSAAGQAGRVALFTALAMTAAALLRLLLLGVDTRLAAVRVAAGTRRALIAASAALVLLGVTGAALAFDAPGALERHYDRFVEGGEVNGGGDARRRLTDSANNGRLDHWRVALEASREHRLKGQGAGTYENAWARERRGQFVVLDAHSLYLETPAELGIVGIVLLGAALVALLAGLARRVGGPDRALYAAIFTMAFAWLIRAGADWDWEMPVISLWLFALGGAVLARPEHARSRRQSPPRLARVVSGLAVLALAITPALIYLSQKDLNRATRSFKHGDCPTAVDQALASTGALSIRPEPFEILAYCDVRLGQPRLGVKAMEEAVERDPDAWQLRYGLAVVRAAAGRDPRPAAAAALRLNPRDPLAKDAVKRFHTSDPRKWKRRARSARLPNG